MGGVLQCGVAGLKDFVSILQRLMQIVYDQVRQNCSVIRNKGGGGDLAEAGVRGRGWAVSRWVCQSVYFSQGRVLLAYLPKVTSLSIEAVNRQLLKNKVPFSFLISSSSSSL